LIDCITSGAGQVSQREGGAAAQDQEPQGEAQEEQEEEEEVPERLGRVGERQRLRLSGLKQQHALQLIDRLVIISPL
jgi:hypothetical protein